jgi:homoserine dehydrogenase
MELARARRQGVAGRVPPLGTHTLRKVPLRPEDDLEGEYYLRFQVRDRPGVLASITGALGSRGISIASVLQPERHESEAVPVVIMTHSAKGAALREALVEIAGGGEVSVSPQVIRIEREL